MMALAASLQAGHDSLTPLEAYYRQLGVAFSSPGNAIQRMASPRYLMLVQLLIVSR